MAVDGAVTSRKGGQCIQIQCAEINKVDVALAPADQLQVQYVWYKAKMKVQLVVISMEEQAVMIIIDKFEILDVSDFVHSPGLVRGHFSR